MRPQQRTAALFFFCFSRGKRSICGFSDRRVSSSSRKLLLPVFPHHRGPKLRRMSSSSDVMFPTIGEFLEQASSRPLPGEPPRFALGNPAGDADSIISAIGIAYLDTTLRQRPTVPVVSIPLEELKSLRPETKYLLALAGISDLDHSIVTVEDDLPNEACVTLVDHNQLVAKFKKWKVEGIIDHHIDEKAHTDTCPICDTSEDRTIAFDNSSSTALVASTCTLIVERWQTNVQETSTELTPIPPTLSILLLGVILLDSINLSAAAGKVTPRDLKAVEILQRTTNWSILRLPSQICTNGVSGVPDLTLLFDALQGQKFKPEFWNGLTALQALKLDYKSFNVKSDNSRERRAAFGISSVLQSMSEFLQKPNVWKSIINQFFPDVQFLGIMFMTVVNDVPIRQMILTSPDESLMQALVLFLTNEGSLKIEVSEQIKDCDTGLVIIKIEQGNAKASRKQVAPIFMDFGAKQQLRENT